MASSSNKDAPLCALPALPNLLPKLPHLKELDGLFSNLSHFHTLLSNSFHQFKQSLDSSFLHALHTNPLLFRLLPPQLHPPSPPRQVREYKRGCHLLSNHQFAAILGSDSVAVVVASNGVLNFLNIYNTLLIVRLILTWFPNPPPVIVNPLSTICDPYLGIFRGIIPPLGGTLDLSPVLAFLVLNVFTNSAAALPAELPSSAMVESASGRPFPSASNLTETQKAWLKRQAASLETGRQSR